jgi:hypothetical protein
VRLKREIDSSCGDRRIDNRACKVEALNNFASARSRSEFSRAFLRARQRWRLRKRDRASPPRSPRARQGLARSPLKSSPLSQDRSETESARSPLYRRARSPPKARRKARALEARRQRDPRPSAPRPYLISARRGPPSASPYQRDRAPARSDRGDREGLQALASAPARPRRARPRQARREGLTREGSPLPARPSAPPRPYQREPSSVSGRSVSGRSVSSPLPARQRDRLRDRARSPPRPSAIASETERDRLRKRDPRPEIGARPKARDLRFTGERDRLRKRGERARP